MRFMDLLTEIKQKKRDYIYLLNQFILVKRIYNPFSLLFYREGNVTKMLKNVANIGELLYNHF